MIVDVGGGTSEVAVISFGGIVVSQSLRVGGDEMDESIVNHVKKEYKLLIGQQTAEEIKLEIGSAYLMKDELKAEVRGRDMLTGLPKTVVMSSDEVRHALEDPVAQVRRHPANARQDTPSSPPTSWWRDACRRRRAAHRPRRAAAPRDAHAGARGRLPLLAVGSGKSLEEFEVIHRSQRNRGRNWHARTAASEPRSCSAGFPTLRTPRARHRISTGRDARVADRPAACGPRWSACKAGTAALTASDGRRPRTPLARSAEPPTSASRRAGRCTVQDAGASVIYPFQVAAERVAQPFEDAAGWAGDVLGAESENEKLRAEVKRLRQQAIQNQRTAVRQNAELRRLLRFRQGPSFPSDYNGVAARIIGRTPGQFEQ